MTDLQPEASSGSPTLKTVVPWLLGITRPVHPPLLFSIAMRLISQTANVALFALAAGGLVAVITGSLPLTHLVIGLLIVSAIKATTYYLEQFSGHYVAFKALELLRAEAFATLWPKAPAVVVRTESGALYASLTRDIDRIEVLYAHTIAPVVAGVVVPLALLGFAASQVGLLPILVPLLCVLFSIFALPFIGFKSSLGGATEVLRVRSRLTQHVTDSVFGAGEVTGYGREEQRYTEMAQLGADIARAHVRAARFRGARHSLNTVFIPVSLVSVLVAGISCGLSPVALAALAGGALALFEAPRGIEDAAGGVDISLASAARLWTVCNLPVEVVDGSGTEVPDGPLAVEWRAVTYSYPGSGGRVALSDFTAEVSPGEQVAIVGPSGVGKSTAAQLLLRYADPDTGEVLLGGQPVGTYTLKQLRKLVAFVPQRGELLRGTVAENLRLGAPQASDEQLWWALEVAGIAGEVRAMPGGLDEATGTEGSGISGGQLQRLCLARALLTEPRVLVLDEFSAYLDADKYLEIRRRLSTELPSLTVIEVTHRRDLIDPDQHIIEL